MDKRLLLLGVLRSQQAHGYGLLEYLKNHSSGGAAIGKSNAYRLLHSMEADGFIASRPERDGSRPEKNVFEVTQAGEQLFQESLLNALAEDATASQPGLSVLNYLFEVEPGAAAEQLGKRRDKVATRFEFVKNVPNEVRELHPALDLEVLQLEVELNWLNKTIAALQPRAEKMSVIK